jgi:hypothetical protein
MDELMYLRSASKAIDFAHRALAAGLPLEPHRGEAWAVVALAVLAATDQLDAALHGTDEILARAREQGAAVTVATILALRAFIDVRRGDLTSAQADAYAAIELGPDPNSSSSRCRRRYSQDSSATRHRTRSAGSSIAPAFGTTQSSRRAPSFATPPVYCVRRPATTKPQSRSCAAVSWITRLWEARTRRSSHGDRPPHSRWLSSAALRKLAPWPPTRCAVRSRSEHRARSGSDALIGPSAERATSLEAALEVLGSSPARLEHARVLVDLGATLRATRQRSAAREPLLQGLEPARRCGARSLERRARAELAATGVRPRTTDRSGADSLTPSERRVAELELAAG